SQGRTVNFENTVIVMTTNAGSVNISNRAGFGEGGAAKESEDRTMKALSEFLRPEFINRVDEIITFRQLDENDFSAIAGIMLGELKTTLGEKGIDFRWTDAAEKAIAKASFSTKFGARNMRRYIQTHVEDQAANIIIDAKGAPIAGIAVDAGEGGLIVKSV
ncbi:MAG: ATP-dependent Clp protease ATP-binding subunit, partial [Clostridia bacterium]|nr:ATP-dependent Clp protease ATP-binding subunit [Clostridia bacterium]